MFCMKTIMSRVVACIVIAALTICIPFSANAKKDKLHSGEPSDVYYGTREGGFALSFGAAPVLNFVGNMFNGTVSQKFEGLEGLKSIYYDGVTMSGKYYFLDNLALTTQFGFNCQGIGDYSYADSKATKPSEITRSGTNSFLAIVGTQYLLRPGKRLQPVLGAGVMYTYANKGYDHTESTNNASSVDESPTNALGIVANVGVEFFIWTAVSLSATVDLGLNGSWTKSRLINGTTNYKRRSGSTVNFVTGRVGGNLALNFYF